MSAVARCMTFPAKRLRTLPLTGRIGMTRPLFVGLRATRTPGSDQRRVLQALRQAARRKPHNATRRAFRISAVRSLPVQLADVVERQCNGRSAIERRTGQPVCRRHWRRTAASLPPANVLLCASLPNDRHPRILHRIPLTPNIHYQRQRCLANNSLAFTK